MKACSLQSIAFRVCNMEAMIAFYTEAFGGDFRQVDTSGLTSWFGEVAGITFKLVPIRDKPDFEGYPLHQLGFEVEQLQSVIQSAIKHGGRQEGDLLRDGDRLHGAIRDPDGNTIELYQSGSLPSA